MPLQKVAKPPKDPESRGVVDGRRPTLRELEVLRTLIGFGKATAAARQLGISQPAVSRAIRALEERTGLTLFRREGGRLIATAEALALHQQSEPIFLTFERLERARWRPEEERSSLRIAAPPTLAQYFMQDLLAEFSRLERDVRIYIEFGPGQQVVTMVANGDMDLAMIDAGPDNPGVQHVVFRTAKAHAVVPASSPLAARDFLTPHDFAGVPFIALARRFPSRTRLDRLFLGAGVTPNIVVEVSTAAAAYEFVRAGVGITIINPFPMCLRPDPELRFLPFRPTVAYETSFVLPSMAPPTAVAQRFIDFVRARQPEDGYSRAIRSV